MAWLAKILLSSALWLDTLTEGSYMHTRAMSSIVKLAQDWEGPDAVSGYLDLDPAMEMERSSGQEIFCKEISAGEETFHFANQTDLSGFPMYESDQNVLEKTPSTLNPSLGLYSIYPKNRFHQQSPDSPPRREESPSPSTDQIQHSQCKAYRRSGLAAPSIHTWWHFPAEYDINNIKRWKFMVTVKVLSTTGGTYFEMTGFSSGGYGGIQDLGKGRKANIFSLWDGHQNDKAQYDWHNEEKGVRVSGFGGEGTGMKSMMDFDWKMNEPYTMWVEGWKEDGIWRINNYVEGNGQSFKMAKFSRKTQALRGDAFYAFLEDWWGQGCNTKREAEFTDPQIWIDGKKVQVSKVSFSDNDGEDRSREFLGRFEQKKLANHGVRMSTGG